MEGYTAIYGKVRLKKVYCEKCKTEAFLIDDTKQCCGEYLSEKTFKSKENKYIIPRDKRRGVLPRKKKEAILKSQDHKCFYCGNSFLKCYKRIRDGKVIIAFLKIHFDHVIPFVMNGDATRFVAACNICNGLKSSKVFSSIEDIKKYVTKRIESKKIEFFELS